MADFAAIFLGACLVNNLVLDAMLGIPAAIAVSRKISAAVNMSLAMLIAMTLSTVITYTVYRYVLVPLDIELLQTISFLLIITVTIKGSEFLIARIGKELHARIRMYIPLTLVNSTVLGAGLLGVQKVSGVIFAAFFGIGAATGLALVTIAMAAMHDRHGSMDVPGPFRGLPVTLVTLGIMAMAFMGFTGVIQ